MTLIVDGLLTHKGTAEASQLHDAGRSAYPVLLGRQGELVTDREPENKAGSNG